ncbi:hypothetical protein [Acinetobacter sp. ANC 3813]|uniref:hypothetical protein n=1 Tax=Acinetobacter sp. ANC 3813 TaxID=1977873 RepID=UPI000A3558B1|nr:hypothetical protein [Acinetobacter sp. ANC 3813]OTG87920.1 hypothetical protein B9T34_16435 [Acinetobacter sp. ANC 3813]
MLTKLRCCSSCNDKFIDLAHIVSVEVNDTDFCGGMITSRGEYARVTISLSNGHIVSLTMENTKLKELIKAENSVPKSITFPELQ